jgi:hypothetical protein
MELVRKLAWAALLVGSGAPSTDPPAPRMVAAAAPVQPAKPATPAATPAQPAQPAKPAKPHAPDTAQPTSGWPLDLDDDEFEGEGWSFWPLPRRRD